MNVSQVESNPCAFQTHSSKPENWQVVTDAFNTIIKPLYGCQEAALKKIQASTDRKCEILFDGKDAVGLVVYKTLLSNEFDLKKSLEIKTLCLLKPKEKSGKGYGSLLLSNVVKAAKVLKAENIHVTVNTQVQTSLQFFTKKGFKIIKTFSNSHLGKEEFVLGMSLVEQNKESKQDSKDSSPSK